MIIPHQIGLTFIPVLGHFVPEAVFFTPKTGVFTPNNTFFVTKRKIFAPILKLYYNCLFLCFFKF